MDINQLKSMTIIQLRVLAKEKGVHSPTTLNKAQLVEKLAEKLNAEQPAEINILLHRMLQIKTHPYA